MAKPHFQPKQSRGKGKASTKFRMNATKLQRPVKTPLTRKGMSPQRLLEASGTISVKTLDAMEKAIDEGCGRVKSHGK